MAVCSGNCRKHISVNFVGIRCLMLKCWHIMFNNHCNSQMLVDRDMLCCRLCVVSVAVIMSVNMTLVLT